MQNLDRRVRSHLASGVVFAILRIHRFLAWKSLVAFPIRIVQRFERLLLNRRDDRAAERLERRLVHQLDHIPRLEILVVKKPPCRGLLSLYNKPRELGAEFDGLHGKSIIRFARQNKRPNCLGLLRDLSTATGPDLII